MIRAHRRHDGEGEAALRVRLGFDDRHRRRLAVTALTGERVLIDLSEAAQLRGGDRLLLEDGRVLAIEAADEDVAEIAAPDAATLVRLAWHLGNRHTPAAVLDGRLRIRRDHVLEAMAERLGGTVTPLAAPFDPEPGAYDGQGHGGRHTHDGHGHGGQAHDRHHHAHHHRDGDEDDGGDEDVHRHPHGDGGLEHGLHRRSVQTARRSHEAGRGHEPAAKPGVATAHRHRVVACGDGADASIAEPPRAATLSNADERAP